MDKRSFFLELLVLDEQEFFYKLSKIPIIQDDPKESSSIVTKLILNTFFIPPSHYKQML